MAPASSQPFDRLTFTATGLGRRFKRKPSPSTTSRLTTCLLMDSPRHSQRQSSDSLSNNWAWCKSPHPSKRILRRIFPLLDQNALSFTSFFPLFDCFTLPLFLVQHQNCGLYSQ